MISIVFFGTHQFAETILKTLLDSGLFDIQLVITMPDKPAGRHQEIQSSAVKSLAQKYNLKIEQPSNLKNFSVQGESGRMTGQLNVVVDYGVIIPQNIIDAPEFGTINIHPSLLPKYRGASPIQSVLMNGETNTGVTIMQMDKEMDHGPILSQEKTVIASDDTYTTLYEKLAVQAGRLLIETIPLYINNKIKPQTQNHEEATFTKILSREDGKIDFTEKTADEIYNSYRGLTPWPGIFTIWNEKRLKLIKIIPAEKKLKAGEIESENNRLFWGCKTGSVEILELQLEGKKPMDARSFINGNRL